jgi:spore maturation protein CgeB
VVSLPHVFKSYPGRIAEAMAASRPAVSWEVPGRPRVREVFEPGRGILLYREPEELREHVLKLEREPGLGPMIARRARARLLARHTTEMRVGQLLSWMESGEPPDYFR